MLGPILVITLLVVLAALIVPYMRGIGVGGESRARTPRDILDERYARGEIDREEYLRRRQDIEGK